MQSNIGVGSPLCHICFQPFGRLEDMKAPYAISCGHVFCVGCLNCSEPACPICGTAFDGHAYSRLLALVLEPMNGHDLRRPILPTSVNDDVSVSASLQNAISGIDERTPLLYVRQLYDTANAFLEAQPRNRYKDLELNVKLLRSFLHAKATLHVQSQLTDELTDKIQQLSSDNVELRSELAETERLYETEKEYFNLLLDEMIEFRNEINELRASVEAMRTRHSEPVMPATHSLTISTDTDEPLSPIFTVIPPTPDQPMINAVDSQPLFIPPFPEVEDEQPESQASALRLGPERDHTSTGREARMKQHLEAAHTRSRIILHRTGYVPVPEENVAMTALRASNNVSRSSSYGTARSELSSRAPTPDESGFSSPTARLDDDAVAAQDMDYAPTEPDEETQAEADRLMSLSTSSITLLKAPQNGMLSDSEYLQMRLHELLNDAGSRARMSSGSGSGFGANAGLFPLAMATPFTTNPTVRRAVTPGNLLSRDAPTAIESTAISEGTPSSSFGTSLRAPPRLDAALLSQHVMDEMRTFLLEVIARVFMRLVSDVPLSAGHAEARLQTSASFLRALDDELLSHSPDSPLASAPADSASEQDVQSAANLDIPERSRTPS